jgi:hypothetical protein
MRKGVAAMQDHRNPVSARLRRWVHGMIWQLPPQPYPSDHPWRRRHGGTPVG